MLCWDSVHQLRLRELSMSFARNVFSSVLLDGQNVRSNLLTPFVVLYATHATFFYIWGGKKVVTQLECILIMKNSQFSGLRNCALLFWPLSSRASLEDFHGAAKNALPLERSDPNHNHVSLRMCPYTHTHTNACSTFWHFSLLDGNINALVLKIPFKHPSQRTLVIKLFLLPQLECDSTKAALNSSVAPWKGFKYNTTSLFSIYMP